MGTTNKGLGLSSPATDSTGAVAHKLDTVNALSAAGGLLISYRTAGTAKFDIGSSGQVTRGEWQGTAVDEEYGGVGSTSYARGDLLYASSSRILAKLALSTKSGALLRGDSTEPAWTTATFPTTAAAGDILHASAANVWAALVIGAAGTFLRSTGTLPAWSTATLPNTATAGDLLHASAANVWTSLAKGTARQLLQTNAAATLPEWASNIDVPGTLDVTGVAVLDSTLAIGRTLGVGYSVDVTAIAGSANFRWTAQDNATPRMHFNRSDAAITAGDEIFGFEFNHVDLGDRYVFLQVLAPTITAAAETGQFDIKVISAGSEATRLGVKGGVVYVSNPNLTSAVDGDLVLKNANFLRAANAAATDTIGLLRLDSSNRSVIGLNSQSWVLSGALTQTTVGAAGAASALPANPTGYLRIDIGGAERVIPFYAQA